MGKKSSQKKRVGKKKQKKSKSVSNKATIPKRSNERAMPPDIDGMVWKSNSITLLATVTGEPYQPARIYYELMDPEKTQNIFRKLRCMNYDRDQSRWVWLYHAESKKLKFEVSYSKIPWNLRPIVIGSFFLKSENEMFLNVNSFERVTKSISFFNKFIPRTVAEVTDVEVVNRIFSHTGATPPQHEDFFDKQSVLNRGNEEVMNKFSNIASTVETDVPRFGLGAISR